MIHGRTHSRGLFHKGWLVILGVVIAFTAVILGVMFSTAYGLPPWRVEFFPARTDAPTNYLDGRLQGRLVMVNGSIRLRPLLPALGLFGRSILIVWPPEYSVRKTGIRTEVVNNEGNAVAQVGYWVTMGGGLTTREYVEQVIGTSIPERYGGPFWLAAPIRR